MVAVEPLEPTSAGAELFRTRALAVDATVDLDAHHSDVVDICQRLDGIPLAIELAAGRTRAFTPADLRARLDDSLPLLTGGQRTAAARHRTLETTIRWSYDLLDAGEQNLLRRLPIFVGAFDLAAAEAVGGDAPSDDRQVDNLLAGLVERSMVAVERGQSGRRFRLLETIRQFAATLAPEEDGLAKRHARWCGERVAQIGDQLRGWTEIEGTEPLAELWPDLRATLAWACARRDPDRATALLRPVATELALRARHGVGDFAERILDITPVSSAATRAAFPGPPSAARRPATSRRTVGSSTVAASPTIRWPGNARAYVSGDGAALHRCLPDVASALEACGDDATARFVQLMAAGLLLSAGRFSEVDTLVSALAEQYRRQSPPNLLHQALQTLGYSASLQQRTADVEQYFYEAALGQWSGGGSISLPPRGDRAEAVEILCGYIDELLEHDNVVAASVVSIEFINMMAAMERYAEARQMIRYLAGVMPTTRGRRSRSAGTICPMPT
ncbi:hypothetical protein [Polymorphospora lycopeni]|uniref:Winged helix-turn-helix domain-containing protein n=1 Tax=Polymorphospora lycopeni TaxID=3140240 RepID=A0ABV5CX69_9ACTN